MTLVSSPAVVRVAGEEGENLVRLLTFLPGKILSQVPYTAQLFFELGALVARVDNELRVRWRHDRCCLGGSDLL